LIFRLKENTDKSKYSEIKLCIDSYNGNLNWTLYKYMFSRKDNYVIAPFVVYEAERDCSDKGQMLYEKEMFSSEKYKFICEKAIEDIPDLIDKNKRGTGLGLYNSLIGITLLPASLIAGVLYDKVNNSAPFYFGSVMALIAAILMCVFYKKWGRGNEIIREP